VVAHVLEHLDRDDAIESLVDVEAVHVAGEDGEVAEAGPAACRSMNAFCVRAFDTATMRALGYCSAIHNDKAPQPQPSSRRR
jgi:hypothetical protein